MTSFKAVNSFALPGSPIHGVGSTQLPVELYTNFTTFEALLRSQLSNDFLLVCELYSEWCGTCAAIRPVLTKLHQDALEATFADQTLRGGLKLDANDSSTEDDDTNGGGESRASSPLGGHHSAEFAAESSGVLSNSIPLRIVSVEPEKVLKSLERAKKKELDAVKKHLAEQERLANEAAEAGSKEPTPTSAPQTRHQKLWGHVKESTAAKSLVSDLTAPQSSSRLQFDSFVRKMLAPWRMTVVPVFLLVRKGQLLNIVEGPSAPQLEQAVRHFRRVSMSESTKGLGGIPITHKEASHFAFVIQTCWRRKKQLNRIGVWIDGKFYTHAEVRAMQEREDQLKQQQEQLELMVASAIILQKMWRGFRERMEFQSKKKLLMQKAKMALSRRRGRKDNIYAHSKLPVVADRKIRYLSKKERKEPLTDEEIALIRKKLRFGGK